MLKKYSWIRDIVLIVGGMVALRSSLVNWYVIPSGSMLPTIKLGDHVIVNKLEYGLMLPFAETQIVSWDKPKRGDIVLFKSLQEDVTLVKRVMGLPGDSLSFEAGVLVINGKSVKETEVSQRQFMDDMGQPGDSKALYLESAIQVEGEALPAHYVLRSLGVGLTSGERRGWKVPEGKAFVLGDNRDESNDSRGWGFVDLEKIYGRARWIFYSIIPGEGILPRFRTDRFFTKLDLTEIGTP